MSRWGYIVTLLLIAGLGAYVLWPQREAAQTLPPLVFEVVPPESWQLDAMGVQQRVDGTRVRLADRYDRELDPARASMLWSQATSLRGVLLREGVGLDQVGAYGLDEQRQLGTAQGSLRWARREGVCYAWNSATKVLYRIDERTYLALEQAAVRLDKISLLDLGEAAELTLSRRDGEQTMRLRRDGADLRLWRDADQPGRPHLGPRVALLVRAIAAIPFQDLDSRLGATAEPVRELSLRAGMADGSLKELELLRDGTQWYARLPGSALPAQQIEPPVAEALHGSLALLNEDYLFAMPPSGYRNPVRRIVVGKGGIEWFRAERLGDEDQIDGRSAWELVVLKDLSGDGRALAGTRVSSAFDVGRVCYALFNAVQVREVTERRSGEAWSKVKPEDIITLEIGGAWGPTVLRLEWDGERVASPTHAGVMVQRSPFLDAMGPDQFLDPVMLGVPPQRVMKIQRKFYDGGEQRGEVYSRGADGRWVQSYRGVAGAPGAGDAATRRHGTANHSAAAPTGGAVDALVAARLARALATARASRVRMAGPADRARLATPDRELAVRLEPPPKDDASNLRLEEDTGWREWGVALQHSGGSWQAVSLDGLLAYTLDDDVVDALCEALEERLVLPVMTAQVADLYLRTRSNATAPLHLGHLNTGTWGLNQGNEAPTPCDDLQVRRYLQRLARLRALRVEQDAPQLEAGETSAEITLRLPSHDGQGELLIVRLGRIDGVGSPVPVSVVVSQPGYEHLPGRVWISSNDAGSLLVDRAFFMKAGDQAAPVPAPPAGEAKP